MQNIVRTYVRTYVCMYVCILVSIAGCIFLVFPSNEQLGLDLG